MDDYSIFSWGFDVLNDDDYDDDAAIADTSDGAAATVDIVSALSTRPAVEVKVKSYKRSSRRKKHTSRQSRKFKDYQDESQLALDILDYRSDRLTRGDFALLTKQLGYIAYNLIDIAAHCSSSDSCWMKAAAAVAVAQRQGQVDEMQQGQVDGMQQGQVDEMQQLGPQPQSYLLPAVARLYPLSRTDPSGRYVRCGKLMPFPTIYWLCDPGLQIRIAGLEDDGWIHRFQQRLTGSSEEAMQPSYRLQMKGAHEAYAAERWSLLSAEDQHFLDDYHSWKHSLQTVGIAGIRDFSAVKCLHCHYAHHLARPEHGNLIGLWVEDLLKKKTQEEEEEAVVVPLPPP